MLLQLMTLIHLNFFKFKHKNGDIQGKEDYLDFGLNNLGFGTNGGTGLAHQKPVDGWFLLQTLSTFSLCSPSSKTEMPHQKSPESLLPLFLLAQPVLALEIGANFLLQKF